MIVICKPCSSPSSPSCRRAGCPRSLRTRWCATAASSSSRQSRSRWSTQPSRRRSDTSRFGTKTYFFVGPFGKTLCFLVQGGKGDPVQLPRRLDREEEPAVEGGPGRGAAIAGNWDSEQLVILKMKILLSFSFPRSRAESWTSWRTSTTPLKHSRRSGLRWNN